MHRCRFQYLFGQDYAIYAPELLATLYKTTMSLVAAWPLQYGIRRHEISQYLSLITLAHQ